jgi:creatinine amidohydrolase
MAVHQLMSMGWPEFERLRSERLTAILPLGAIEAHGPHLPLGTDIVIAVAMANAGARRLAARGFDVVVLPCVPVAPAPFAAAFAGTIDTPAAATTALVTGVARSMTRHGVRVTALANAHHDPAHVAALRSATQAANRDGGSGIVFPDLTRRRWASRLSPEFQSGACHAGRYEGSIVLSQTPEWVRHDRMSALPPNPSSLVDAIARGDRTFAQAGGPQAYFGWPADASADEGRQLVETLAQILEEAVIEAFESRSPTGKESMPDQRTGSDWKPTIVNPASRPRPRGFSHGVIAPAGGRMLSVAGQTAAGDDGRIAASDFASQFDAALAKVIEVVESAGGEPRHITRLTIYVTSIDVYARHRAALGLVWKKRMADHYPAMALIGVTALVDQDATVEIEADAILPPQETSQ